MNRKERTEIETEQVFLPLMKFESSMALLLEPGITTISFFSADEDKNIHYDTSLRMLKSRMKKICEANPWLVGRLVQKKQEHKRLLCCAYPKKISDDDIDEIFSTTNSDEMESLSSSATPYPVITKAMKKSGAIVKTGYQLTNKNDRLTKLTFLPIANGTEYALCFSVAHTIADGFTYYRILSMLSNEDAIESLQEERLQKFETSITESIGLKEKKTIHSPWLLANIISRWIFSSPMKVSADFVDIDKIAKVKEDAKKKRHPEDPKFYISTNDILTSSFARESKADALLMAFNLRGRHTNATESHGGNYETVLYYDEESFEKPDAIRESLRNGPPYKRTSGNELPSRLKQLRFKFSFITSWSFSYFKADLHLWDSQEAPSNHLVKLHLPIYDVHEIPPVPMGIIFKPCKDKLAMMYFYPPKNKFYKDKDITNSCLGNTVNEAIFAD